MRHVVSDLYGNTVEPFISDLGITDLVNHECFPLKSGLNSVPTLKIVHKAMLIKADDMKMTLDAIANYCMSSKCFSTNTDVVLFVKGVLAPLIIRLSCFLTTARSCEGSDYFRLSELKNPC